jgi:hypothetical protein
MMSTNPATTVSKAPSANGGNASAATVRVRLAGAARQAPQHGVILDAARGNRKFVEFDRAPGEHRVRKQQQRIESVATVSVASEAACRS